jgi:hypothetical protein
MYIDSLTITAIVVFAIAMVLFVRKCFIHSCLMNADEESSEGRDGTPGAKK